MLPHGGSTLTTRRDCAITWEDLADGSRAEPTGGCRHRGHWPGWAHKTLSMARAGEEEEKCQRAPVASRAPALVERQTIRGRRCSRSQARRIAALCLLGICGNSAAWDARMRRSSAKSMQKRPGPAAGGCSPGPSRCCHAAPRGALVSLQCAGYLLLLRKLMRKRMIRLTLTRH